MEYWCRKGLNIQYRTHTWMLQYCSKEHIISTKNNDRTNITIIMIAIVHSIYSQSVHAPALDAGLMDNDAERYCRSTYGLDSY